MTTFFTDAGLRVLEDDLVERVARFVYSECRDRRPAMRPWDELGDEARAKWVSTTRSAMSVKASDENGREGRLRVHNASLQNAQAAAQAVIADLERRNEQLQNDLEEREAALGRATSLAYELWLGCKDDPGFSWLGMTEWRDARDWVAGTGNDESEASVNYSEEEVDRAVADADQGQDQDEEVTRWYHFTTEEVETIAHSCAKHPLGREAYAERQRRRGGYRGPGVYRRVGGESYEVLGIPYGLSFVVMRGLGEKATGGLIAENSIEFNASVDGRPRYTWVREL